MTLQTPYYVRLGDDKLKTYLHYNNAYNHQTSQGGDIQLGASTHKVKRPFA